MGLTLGWRKEAEKVPKKLGLNDHDTNLWNHLLKDVECLDKAVKEKDGISYLTCLVDLSFHEGELFQRGIDSTAWTSRKSLAGRIYGVDIPFWDTAEGIIEDMKAGISRAGVAPTATIPRSEFPPEELARAEKMLKEIEKRSS